MSTRCIGSTTKNSTCPDVCFIVDVSRGGMAQLVSSTNAQQDTDVAMTMMSSSFEFLRCTPKRAAGVLSSDDRQ